MENTRQNLPALTLLALVLVAGCFAAGYLLMARDAPPTPPPVTSAPTPPATAPHLVIKYAVYGDIPDGIATEVTASVAAKVAHDALIIAATNDTFGDPAPNINKKLRVDYVLDGTPHSRIVLENSTLSIKSGPPRLLITKALYGDLPDGPATDVTEKVTQVADTDFLSIAAVNDNFGDPAPGIPKILRIDYTFDGKPRTKTAAETDTLTIPDDKVTR